MQNLSKNRQYIFFETSHCTLEYLQGPVLLFTGLQPSSGAPGPPDGCCTLGPPGSVWGKAAAPLLDAVELLLFERLPICVGCNGKAGDIGLTQLSAAPPDFSSFL